MWESCKAPSMLTALKVKGSTCFLRPNDEKLWESVTGLFFGPNVLVSFVFTGILKHSVEDQRQISLDGAHNTAQPLQPEQTHRETTLLSRQDKDWAYLCLRTNPFLALPAEPVRAERPLLSQGIRRKPRLEAT